MPFGLVLPKLGQHAAQENNEIPAAVPIYASPTPAPSDSGSYFGDSSLAQTPPSDAFVSLRQAEQEYAVVQSAMATRDFESFSSLVYSGALAEIRNFSYERIDALRKPHAEIVSEAGLGSAYALPEKVSEKQYFEMFGPEIFYWPHFSPSPETTIAVGYPSGIASDYFSLYSSTTVQFNASGYNHPGFVGFAKENGEWKVAGDRWFFGSAAGVSSGDQIPFGASAHVVARNVSSSDTATLFQPRVLRIKIGEYVSWQNISGYLFSYMPAEGNFSSGTLYQGTYTHQFAAPGAYFYELRGGGMSYTDPAGFIGVVVVE